MTSSWASWKTRISVLWQVFFNNCGQTVHCFHKHTTTIHNNSQHIWPSLSIPFPCSDQRDLPSTPADRVASWNLSCKICVLDSRSSSCCQDTGPPRRKGAQAPPVVFDLARANRSPIKNMNADTENLRHLLFLAFWMSTYIIITDCLTPLQSLLSEMHCKQGASSHIAVL